MKTEYQKVIDKDSIKELNYLFQDRVSIHNPTELNIPCLGKVTATSMKITSPSDKGLLKKIGIEGSIKPAFMTSFSFEKEGQRGEMYMFGKEYYFEMEENQK